MKKILSISLVLAMFMAMLPCVHTAAADTTTPKFPSPQYIAEDFNDGLANASYTVSNGTVSEVEGGRNGSKALYFTSTVNYSGVRFPLRTLPDNVYHISAWVKFDETPKTQTINFVIYNPRVENGATSWNEFRTAHEPIEAGKWVEVSATYVGKGTAPTL